MEETCSSETTVLTRTTRRHIPEDGILHSRRRENLKSYISQYVCTVNDIPWKTVFIENLTLDADDSLPQ
jgi:hypothetical protein